MDQSITCSFFSDSYNFVLSSIYGSNKGVDRRRLWSHLFSLNGDSSKPWLLARDFNVLAHPSESSSFDGSQMPNSDVRDFIDCMHELAIFYLVYVWLMFTWTNRQREGFIARKLDRVLVNCASL